MKGTVYYGLNDNNMLIERIHELTATEDTNVVTRKQVLAWTE